MANEQNLVKGDSAHKLTAEEQSKGGKKSAEVRREKRELRKALEILMEQDVSDRKGNTRTGTEAMALAVFQKALKGDIKAFEVVRDTVGQKPVEKVQIAEVDEQTIKELEKVVLDNDQNTSD